MARRKKLNADVVPAGDPGYAGFLAGVASLLDMGRRTASRAVNAVLAATYWEVGRRLVEFEQGGKARAGYGEALLARLAADLTATHGWGFSERKVLASTYRTTLPDERVIAAELDRTRRMPELGPPTSRHE